MGNMCYIDKNIDESAPNIHCTCCYEHSIDVNTGNKPLNYADTLFALCAHGFYMSFL